MILKSKIELTKEQEVAFNKLTKEQQQLLLKYCWHVSIYKALLQLLGELYENKK